MYVILFSGGTDWVVVRLVTLVFVLIACLRLLPGKNRQVPNYRPRPGRTSAFVFGAVVIGALVVSGMYLVRTPPQPTTVAEPSRIAIPTVTIPKLKVAPTTQVGIFVPGATSTYKRVAAFQNLTGTNPAYVVYFSGWNDPFQIPLANEAAAHGAKVLVQMQPIGVSLGSIAAGASDSYLKAFGQSIENVGHPVLLSFAPEANGPFYSYGCGHSSAASYRAAWRHVHDVINGVTNDVTWVWDMNRIYSRTCPLTARWPGSKYVDEMAVDGYWRGPGDTFNSTLRPTIRRMWTLGHKPVLLGETGAKNGTEAAGWIRSVFTGVRMTPHMVGLIWFNSADWLGDYKLQDNPAALAAFQESDLVMSDEQYTPPINQRALEYLGEDRVNARAQLIMERTAVSGEPASWWAYQASAMNELFLEDALGEGGA